MTSECPVAKILTPIEYRERHEKIVQYIYLKACWYYRILDCEKWYKQQPETITEVKGASILWDFPIETDRKLKRNRPGLVVKDYKRKICLLIEISVPTDNNISVKEYDEEIQKLGNKTLLSKLIEK